MKSKANLPIWTTSYKGKHSENYYILFLDGRVSITRPSTQHFKTLPSTGIFSKLVLRAFGCKFSSEISQA